MTVPPGFQNLPYGNQSYGTGNAITQAEMAIGGSGVDPIFQQDFINALWESGVDVSVIDIGQLNQLLQSAWQDPYLQNLYSAGSVSDVTVDPSTGTTITNLLPYLKTELFNPTGTHSMALVSMGIQMLQQSGKPLSSQQSQFGFNLGQPSRLGTGANQAVLSAIQRAAQETGVPYNLALAVAMAESGLDPNKPGDYVNGQPTSFGLFQLHRGGELGDLTPQQAMDPYTNALRALQEFQRVAQQNPGITSDPGRWAAAAQRPRDPATYATRVQNLLNSSFGGNASSLVPKPFDGQYPITLDYGDHFGSETEEGIDFAMNQGTSVYTPFAGTIRTEDDGKANWGKRVFVQLDNGFIFAVGHMHAFSVADGQRVNPGDILGESGGNVNDPSSGASYGSGDHAGEHIEVQWISPGGQYLNPHTIIDPIMAGIATFQGLNLAGAEGSGVSAAQAKYRAEGIDPILMDKYPTAVSEFQKFFGRQPTSAELLSLVNHGTSAAELESYLRLQPSHIPGVSMGMYQDTKANLDSVSQSIFGHAGTDQMVSELAAAGMSDAKSVQFWLEQQDIAGKMGPDWQKTYSQIYKAASPVVSAYSNDSGFDPRWAQSIYSQAYQNQPQPSPSGPPPSSGSPDDLQKPNKGQGGI